MVYEFVMGVTLQLGAIDVFTLRGVEPFMPRTVRSIRNIVVWVVYVSVVVIVVRDEE